MIETAILLSHLQQRIKDLPGDFKGFVRSECQWEKNEYHHYMCNTDVVDPVEHEDILKIAQALAVDLLELIKRYRKAVRRERKSTS